VKKEALSHFTMIGLPSIGLILFFLLFIGACAWLLRPGALSFYKTLSKLPLNEPLLDHDYDGIQEYDNPIPKLFSALFVGSIALAGAYLVLVSVFRPNPMASPERPLSPLTKGASVYSQKCAGCHGQDGGGLVGPNLCDNIWIYGKGSPKDILKIVSEGVPEKGMIRWATVLTKEELAAVVAHVYSFKNTP